MDHVTLDIAKRLKEAGWAQTGYSFWSKHGNFFFPTSTPVYHLENYYAAPSIGELLETFKPVEEKLVGGTFVTSVYLCKTSENEYFASAPNPDVDQPPHQSPSVPNPADALALLWIALRPKGK